MSLPLISQQPGVPGIIAIGGDAIGIVAIGVSATGVIAFGVQARGLIAIACGTSVGAIAISFGASVGALAMSVGFAGGLWGGAYGVELPVWPGPVPRKVEDTGEGSLDGLKPGDARWLRVAVDGKGVLRHRGEPVEASVAQEISLTSGPARVLLREQDGGTVQVVRFEPLTSLAKARALWLASVVARLVVLVAIGWFLSR
jgi:hypothetical protein